MPCACPPPRSLQPRNGCAAAGWVCFALHDRDHGARPPRGDRYPAGLRRADCGCVHRALRPLDAGEVLAAGLTAQLIDTSSTSTTSVALAGTPADALPADPNPSAGGT